MTNVPDGATPPQLAELDAELVDRYLAARCTSEDWLLIDRWIGGDPKRRALLTGLRRGVTLATEYPALPDATRTHAALHALQFGQQPKHQPRHPTTQRRATIIQWTSAFATPWIVRTAAGLGVGFALLIAVRLSGPAATVRNTPTRTYTTSTGQQAHVTLGDGTRVTLAPRTTLRVTAFDNTHRTVTLDGEAHFDVATATGTPFIVRTGAVSTRVLGTQFLVRHYATDPSVRVAVRSGKVVVAADHAPSAGVTLAAGHMGIATDSGAKLEGDVARYTEWMNGQLVFREAPTTEVLAMLTRWYGYQFRLADSALAREKITVRISTKSSADALAMLKLYLDVDLAFDGNIVTLRPRQDSPIPSRTRRGADALITPMREVGR